MVTDGAASLFVGGMVPDEKEREGIAVGENRLLTADEAKALRAEMVAGFEAGKILKIPRLTGQLLDATGVNQTSFHRLLSGRGGATVETAAKIRASFAKVLNEPTAHARPEKKPPAVKRSAALTPTGRVKKKMSPGFVDALHKRLAKENEKQTPTRERLQEFKTRNGIKIASVAATTGIGQSALSYFLSGRTLRPTNYQKLVRYLDKRTGAPRDPVPAAKTKAIVQQHFPFADANVVSVTATRIRRADLTERQSEPREGGTAQEIARAFVEKIGIEAIEAILAIAKSSNVKEG